MRKLLPLIGVVLFLFLSNGFAWAQTLERTARGIGELAPFKVDLYDEALYLKPEIVKREFLKPGEQVRHRLWLWLSTWLVVDARSAAPVTLVGEYNLTPPGQWTMERTTRFSLGENPRLRDEKIRPGINTFFKQFRLAFIDFPPESLSGSTEASLASLFDYNQKVKVKVGFRAPYCPGCPPVAGSEEKEYDLKPYAYALIGAAGSGNVRAVQELLDKGTDPDSATVQRWTALMEAASKGRSRVVKMLLDHGARVNLMRKGFPFVISQCSWVIPTGETALMAACWAGDTETVRLLLSAHAWVNVDRKDGWTPLLAASSAGHAQIVRMLLANGARVDFTGDRGEYSASALADINGNAAVRRILRAHGDPIRVPWDVLTQKRLTDIHKE